MRPVILVHGAWHGAWCWAALQAELDRRGVPTYAVDLPGHGASPQPLGDLYGDAGHVAAVLAALAGRGPAVLVGHSYGGAVITEAAARSSVPIAHLLYVAAFALDEGESVFDVLQKVPGGPVRLSDAMRSDGAGCFELADPAATREALYGSCPPALVPAAMARLDRQPIASFAQAATGSPRRATASTYVTCRRDEAVHLDQQQVMAARCDTQVELDSDHSPFLSAVRELAEVVETIAGER